MVYSVTICNSIYKLWFDIILQRARKNYIFYLSRSSDLYVLGSSTYVRRNGITIYVRRSLL